MSNDLSELFTKIGAQAKRAVCPATAVLLRGAQSAAATASIASLAQLPLYRIDMNAVTRKYMGETEKNLDAVFDAAGQTRSVLFFDEADALLGNRSEIKYAHDRSANYVGCQMVQRIAKFHGVVAFAAAEASVIDPALPGVLRYEIRLPDLETDGTCTRARWACPAATTASHPIASPTCSGHGSSRRCLTHREWPAKSGP
jgi:SpoVK/Ycf46/Vps4 family AAA+-type ATPase